MEQEQLIIPPAINYWTTQEQPFVEQDTLCDAVPYNYHTSSYELQSPCDSIRHELQFISPKRPR